MITLVNGPLDGRKLEDSGAMPIRMAIYDGSIAAIGAKVGYAIYEPNETRELAFWSHNVWHGPLNEIIDA